MASVRGLRYWVRRICTWARFVWRPVTDWPHDRLPREGRLRWWWRWKMEIGVAWELSGALCEPWPEEYGKWHLEPGEEDKETDDQCAYCLRIRALRAENSWLQGIVEGILPDCRRYAAMLVEYLASKEDPDEIEEAERRLQVAEDYLHNAALRVAEVARNLAGKEGKP